jgi:hypothetical protein
VVAELPTSPSGSMHAPQGPSRWRFGSEERSENGGRVGFAASQVLVAGSVLRGHVQEEAVAKGNEVEN